MTPQDILYLGQRPLDEMESVKGLLANWQLKPLNLKREESLKLLHLQASLGLFVIDYTMTEQMLERLESILRNNHFVLWIGLIDSSTLNSNRIRQLIADHAFDYHTLPADPLRLQHTVGHAHGMALLQQRESQLSFKHSSPELLGSSESIQHLRRLISRLSSTNTTVLISGESGTGKELVARELHRQSSRRQQPFIVVNCAALPESLIQSELFGHEKGAFTNANRRHIGKIESANGGTLLLDEIGDLPLSQQTNLLRFLEDGTIERVGGRKSLHIDARILAATNIDLLQATREQRFREDLFYRINVINLAIAPLRERPGDSIEIAESLLNCFTTNSKRPLRFSQHALDAINHYHWPGNIRELRNRIFRAASICEGQVLTEKELGLKSSDELTPMPLAMARAQADINAIRASLQYTRNNISEASRLLEVSRPTLYHLISKYELEKDNESPAALAN